MITAHICIYAIFVIMAAALGFFCGCHYGAEKRKQETIDMVNFIKSKRDAP